MHWHASLLQSILERQGHPDMSNAQKLAALDKKTWQQRRRETKREARQGMIQGRRLVQHRESNKRKFADMSATEQQIIHDFETNKCAKQHAQECGKTMPVFRGKMW